MTEEQIEMLMASGIDYHDGIKRFDGNEALFRKFLLRYAENPLYQELVQAFDSEDWESAEKIAHTLKGVVGTLSFVVYFEIISALVEDLRARNIDGAKACFIGIHQAELEVLSALSHLA